MPVRRRLAGFLVVSHLHSQVPASVRALVGWPMYEHVAGRVPGRVPAGGTQPVWLSKVIQVHSQQCSPLPAVYECLCFHVFASLVNEVVSYFDLHLSGSSERVN